MTPFLTEEEAAAGEELSNAMMGQLTKIPPKVCMAALMTCLTFAAAETGVALESIFQAQRNLMKALKEAQKNQIVAPSDELVVPDEPKIVVP